MKRTKLRKKPKKRSALAIEKDKAWDVFSLYIRTRDKGTCFTCGRREWDEEKGEWSIKGFNAGHYRHGVLDFDEMNINCQCVRCNFRLSGNLGEYTIRLIEKYGIDAVNELRARATKALKGKKLSIEQYNAITKKYKNLLAELP